MTYKVVWQSRTLSALAEIWLRSDTAFRTLVNQATVEIDRVLKHDPWMQGESRSTGRRILFVLPLGIIFRVDRSANVVYVLRVWSVRPRNR